MKKLGLSLLLLSLALPLQAKQTPPMDAKLVLVSREEKGAVIEYRVRFDLTPQVRSEKVLLRLQLPDDLFLSEGFYYWEGVMPEKVAFSREFVLQAPSAAEREISVAAQMFLDQDARQALVVPLALDPKPDKEKASSERPFQTPAGKRTRR